MNPSDILDDADRLVATKLLKSIREKTADLQYNLHRNGIDYARVILSTYQNPDLSFLRAYEPKDVAVKFERRMCKMLKDGLIDFADVLWCVTMLNEYISLSPTAELIARCYVGTLETFFIQEADDVADYLISFGRVKHNSVMVLVAGYVYRLDFKYVHRRLELFYNRYYKSEYDNLAMYGVIKKKYETIRERFDMPIVEFGRSRLRSIIMLDLYTNFIRMLSSDPDKMFATDFKKHPDVLDDFLKNFANAKVDMIIKKRVYRAYGKYYTDALHLASSNVANDTLIELMLCEVLSE